MRSEKKPDICPVYNGKPCNQHRRLRLVTDCLVIIPCPEEVGGDYRACGIVKGYEVLQELGQGERLTA